MNYIKEKLKKFINDNPFLVTSYNENICIKYNTSPFELNKIEEFLIDIFKHAFYSANPITITDTDIDKTLALVLYNDTYAFTIRLSPFSFCVFKIDASERQDTIMIKLRIPSESLITLFTNVMNKLPEELKTWFLLKNIDFVEHVKHKQSQIDNYL